MCCSIDNTLVQHLQHRNLKCTRHLWQSATDRGRGARSTPHQIKKNKKKSKQMCKACSNDMQNLHATVVFSSINNLNSKTKTLSASKDVDLDNTLVLHLRHRNFNCIRHLIATRIALCSRPSVVNSSNAALNSAVVVNSQMPPECLGS